MKEWHLTDGLLVQMDTGRGGKTWLWLCTIYDSSVMVEWNYAYNMLQVSVAHGDFLSLAEWWKPEWFSGASDTEERILMVLRQWLVQYSPALSKPQERQKSATGAAALLDLVSDLNYPAE